MISNAKAEKVDASLVKPDVMLSGRGRLRSDG
jgi:hypothetical protein